MKNIQLEFNLDDKDPADLELYVIQKQIDNISESMGKMRRRLFAEMGELKKIVGLLQKENAFLRSKVDNPEFEYDVEGKLFDIKQALG